MKIVIIDYGAGNVFSVQRAVERLGYEVLLSRDPMVVQSADRVIFPGVGQASVAMKRLWFGSGYTGVESTCSGHLFRYAIDVQIYGRRRYSRIEHFSIGCFADQGNAKDSSYRMEYYR